MHAFEEASLPYMINKNFILIENGQKHDLYNTVEDR